MKVVIQRVKKASVIVANKIISQVKNGMLILLGVGKIDTTNNADQLVKKIVNLRIFNDENKKMNRSIRDINGEILVVSQFTLYADTRKGNRPSFIKAASPDKAKKLYQYFIDKCRNMNIKTMSGIFGALMKVKLINDGPITIILEN